MAKNIFSVAYVVDGDKIIIGLKKDRPQLNRERKPLGVGIPNGFGGLKKPTETIEQTAKRETEQESGLEVLKLEKCGIALVRHDYDEEQIELHFFLVTEYRGQPKETAEMIPMVLSRDKIPYEKMWPNDRHTLPLFLAGKKCIAIFTLNRARQLTRPPRVKTVAVLPDTINWDDYLA